MSEKLVEHQITESVATITLNRPKALNALNNDMIADLIQLFKQFSDDPKVRVIVLEGKGRSFCAGDDLIDMGTENHPNPHQKLTEYREGYPAFVKQMRATEKPIICKIHGYALGAGFEMALASDIIIAEEESKMGLPFVLRGIAAGTYLLPKVVGYHKASELLFTGEMVTASEAKELGILNHVVPKEELGTKVDELVQKLQTGATRAMGLMKLAMNQSLHKNVSDALNEQAYATTLSFHTDDFVEGKQAFFEKRNPEFKGK